MNASRVYIGKLESKMKEIKNNDDETAHIDVDASLLIKFQFQIMILIVEKFLKMTKVYIVHYLTKMIKMLL